MTQGKGRKNKIKIKREANHKRLLKTENKPRVAVGCWVEGWAKWVMGIKEGICWDEHWVFSVSDKPLISTPETIIIVYVN